MNAENHQTEVSNQRGLAIIVAFFVATVICNISFIPYAIILILFDNSTVSDYILMTLFFISILVAIGGGIMAFKATYARMLK